MPFVEKLLGYKSVSFVGMEKNAGKTQTLNYVLGRLRSFSDTKIAISSIGIDGEQIDQVTHTSKPEIHIYKGTKFVTAQALYLQREIVSCIEDVDFRTTALGRLITAEAISDGKVLLAGPSDTKQLKNFIDRLSKKVNLCLIDGALSRMSFGSPCVTDAMVLSTGAAVSASLQTMVDKTRFTYELIRLPKYSGREAEELKQKDSGVYAVADEEIVPLEIPSLLMIERYKDVIFSHGRTIYISGVLNEKFMRFVCSQKEQDKTEIIIKDFTKNFASPESIRQFLRRGGRLSVLYPANLIAITANPISPTGYNFDNERMLDALRQAIPADIYNIKTL